MLSLCCCAWAFSTYTERGILSSCDAPASHLQWLLLLWSGGSRVVVVKGLGCSTACGIFLDQGSNLCLLHWQENSLPRSHQGSPQLILVEMTCGCHRQHLWLMLWLLGNMPRLSQWTIGNQVRSSFLIHFYSILSSSSSPLLCLEAVLAPGMYTIDIYEGNNKWKKNSVVLLRVGKKCVHDDIPCGGRKLTALKTRSVPLSSVALSSLMNMFIDLFILPGCLQSCIHLQRKVNINHRVLGSINTNKYLLLTWNSNVTGCPIFLFANNRPTLLHCIWTQLLHKKIRGGETSPWDLKSDYSGGSKVMGCPCLWINTRSGVLDHRIVLFFIFFLGISIVFSFLATPIYIPTNNVQAFPSLHIFGNFCYLLSF